MKTYSRPYSTTDWDKGGDPTVRAKTYRNTGTPYVDIQFDTAPEQTRSRVASIELTLDDLIEQAERLSGGADELITELQRRRTRSRDTALRAWHDAEKQLAEKCEELEKLRQELEEVKMTRAMRVSGGAL